MEQQLKKDRKKVRSAGAVAIVLGVWTLLAAVLLGVLLNEGFGGDLFGPLDLAMGGVMGLVLLALSVGILRRSTVCLGIATVITAVLLLWNVFIRLAWGIGTRQIWTLAVPALAFISMAGAFGPMRRLKRAARSAPERPSTEDRLRELESLRQKGLVSEEEYGTRRQQIISEM